MFGMKYFRSDVIKVGGAIKSKPSDFQVTEIDPEGRLVQLNLKEETASICDDSDLRKSGKQQLCETKQNVNHGKDFDPMSEGTEPFPLSVDLTKHHKRLLSDLNETFYDRISEYAQKCKNEMCQKDGGTAIESKMCPLSLGIFHDKTQRTVLYAAVKYLFPHLKACVSENHEVKICLDEMYITFRPLLSEEDSDSLQRFVSRKKTHETLDLSDMPSKSVRTQVHKLINQHYGSFLESKTFTNEDPGGTTKTRIQLRVKERSRGQKRKPDGGRVQMCFTGFTLQKQNLETLDAIQIIAKALKVRPSDISYAGIKDKRAVTVQAMAVTLPLQRVEGLFCNLKEKGMAVGNFCERAGPITSGELWGNDFRITLRNIWLPGKQKLYADKCPVCKKCILKNYVMQAAKHLKENGFINYFGKQRFGEEWFSPSGSLTADIGLAMLQKDYIKAVKLILTPDPKKTDAVNNAKKLFQETFDTKAALKMMPPFKARECMLLKALHRHGSDKEGCCKALLSIPHHMRQLYIHSFTSLVWNHMASQRIADHGFEVIPGDLVIPRGTYGVTRDKVISISTDNWNEASKYTVYDVVLPLPGNTVKYPQNGVGQAYSNFLNSHGLDDCQFRLKALQINIPGDYRRLVELPVNFDWEIFQDEEGEDSSVRDLLAVRKVREGVCNSIEHITEFTDIVSQQDDRKATEACVINDTTTNDVTNSEVKRTNKMEEVKNVCDCGNELKFAEFNLVLNFRLPSSTYATSLLREILEENVQ